jgi:hypothetical protein
MKVNAESPVMSSGVACRAVVERRWETSLTVNNEKFLGFARNDKYWRAMKEKGIHSSEV